jgi:hypothetical protein
MKTKIEIEAEELATKLDNPCSVMIRKLLAEIEYLKKCNDKWQQINELKTNDSIQKAQASIFKEMSKND